MNIGVVLDVDGVLYKDYKPIDGAKESLKLLKEKKIPFIFLTNSGGMTEKEKKEQYEKIFEQDFEERQVIMAHTPLKTLNHLKNERVLVIGASKIQNEKILKRFGESFLK